MIDSAVSQYTYVNFHEDFSRTYTLTQRQANLIAKLKVKTLLPY